MRFVLIDKVLEVQPGVSITAVKNLTLAEEYLADHFPGFPVMPGVLMLESLVQTGAWLMRQSQDFEYSTILLKEARAVKYNSFVAPGNSLQLTMTVKKQAGPTWEFQGAGTVNGESAVSAKLTLHGTNLAEHNPDLAGSDEARRKEYRSLWKQVWSGA